MIAAALATVREAGVSDAQIFDIVALVMQFSMTNYSNKAMKTDIDVFPVRRRPRLRARP